MVETNIQNSYNVEEELRQRNRELALLNRVIAATAADLETEAFLETVCCELVQTFELVNAVGVLIDRETECVQIAAEYPRRSGNDNAPLHRFKPIKDDALFTYLETHPRPPLVEDPQNDPLLEPIRHLLPLRGAVSILMCPITVDGETIGSLNLGTIERRTFSKSEHHLIRSVVEQMGFVLARASLEIQHRQAQKREAVGRLTAGIAHDFNNLLTVINGFASLMQLTLDENDCQQERVSSILNAGNRGANLIRQLLTFSRKEVVKPQVLDLNATLSKMDAELRHLIGDRSRDALRRRLVVHQGGRCPDRTGHHQPGRQCARCHAGGWSSYGEDCKRCPRLFGGESTSWTADWRLCGVEGP